MLRMMITMMMVMMRPLSQRVNPQLRTLVYGSGPLRGSVVVSRCEVPGAAGGFQCLTRKCSSSASARLASFAGSLVPCGSQRSVQPLESVLKTFPVSARVRVRETAPAAVLEFSSHRCMSHW